jgi:hypothetical protein
MKKEEFDIVIAGTLQNSIKSAHLDTYTLSIKSMRFFDGDGVATTEPAGTFTDTASFTVEAAGTDDELIVKTSSNDPDATTLQVEDDSKSDWYNVFTFDLDTDDSVNDIELTTVVVEVYVSSSTYDTLVDDAEIDIDGVNINDVTVTFGNTATATLTFDVDGDVTIDAGDRIAAELMLKFKSLVAGNEGVTVTARVTTANANAFEAEGAEDLEATTPDQLRGSASGDSHTLRTTGIDVSKDSIAAAVTVVDAVGVNDYGTFTIAVEVTAFEQDVYISTTPGTAMSYVLQDGAGSTSVTGSRSVTLTSTGDDDGSYFEILQGETETLTLAVTYTPGVANTASRLVLSSISFADTPTTPDKTQTTLPANDYRTAVITMVN